MFGPEYARACGIEALEPLGIYLPGGQELPRCALHKLFLTHLRPLPCEGAISAKMGDGPCSFTYAYHKSLEEVTSGS